jgi:hypothetical protein
MHGPLPSEGNTPPQGQSDQAEGKWRKDLKRAIKLHGSVNWARWTAVNSNKVFTDPPTDLRLDDELSFAR